MSAFDCTKDYHDLSISVEGIIRTYGCVKHLFTSVNPNYVLLYREVVQEDDTKLVTSVALLFRPQIILITPSSQATLDKFLKVH